MICIAGGSGLAPLISLLQDAAKRRVRRDCVLLFGGRRARDVYATEEISAIRDGWTAGFDYWPILSEEELDGYRHGLVTDFVPAALQKLGGGTHGYMCGPPGMIDAGINALVASGLALEDIHYDKFTDSSTRIEKET
jgi:p-cymene monooxygenase electron transfer component